MLRGVQNARIENNRFLQTAAPVRLEANHGVVTRGNQGTENAPLGER